MEDKHKRGNRNGRYMINRTAIQQWSEHAPWIDNAQIEQDLIICRALVSIFSDEFLASQLAFRGGTALHKLYLSPQPRYSEDIDLVQITPGPIKAIMYRLGEVLDWLPDRVTKQKRYNTLVVDELSDEVTFSEIKRQIKQINIGVQKQRVGGKRFTSLRNVI